MFSRILVGYDGSETASRAVARAAGLARILNAELVAVFAARPGSQKEGEQALQEVKDRYSGISIRPVLREGDPTDVILDVSEEEKVDVIVVGNKGMTGTKRLLLGSVPNNVSHHAPCNILIVNTTQPGPGVASPLGLDSFESGYRKLLCGIDGSNRAVEALRLAGTLATQEKSALLVVCAYQPLDQATSEGWRKSAPPEFVWRLTPNAAAEAAVERAAKLAEKGGVKAETLVAEGDPSEVILRVAEERGVDLIVVGNKGTAGAQRFVLGSVPNKISHHVRCDLLIVHSN